jgi:hypothetical protein
MSWLRRQRNSAIQTHGFELNVRIGSKADIRGLTHLPCASLDCMINGAKQRAPAAATALAGLTKGLQ